MKTLRYFVLIKLIIAGIAVCAQPGSYYPPPSAIDYHTDTLTIYPPDSLPGDPVVLLAYNIYVDSVFYNDVQVAEPGDTINYIIEEGTILPGSRSFCAKAVYNEWISDQTCDTATLIYGYSLPFLEDWTCGSFEGQQWVSSTGNWVIEYRRWKSCAGRRLPGRAGSDRLCCLPGELSHGCGRDDDRPYLAGF